MPSVATRRLTQPLTTNLSADDHGYGAFAAEEGDPPGQLLTSAANDPSKRYESSPAFQEKRMASVGSPAISSAGSVADGTGRSSAHNEALPGTGLRPARRVKPFAGGCRNCSGCGSAASDHQNQIWFACTAGCRPTANRYSFGQAVLAQARRPQRRPAALKYARVIAGMSGVAGTSKERLERSRWKPDWRRVSRGPTDRCAGRSQNGRGPARVDEPRSRRAADNPYQEQGASAR